MQKETEIRTEKDGFKPGSRRLDILYRADHSPHPDLKKKRTSHL